MSSSGVSSDKEEDKGLSSGELTSPKAREKRRLHRGPRRPVRREKTERDRRVLGAG